MFAEIIDALVLGFVYGLGPCTMACAPLIVPLIVATAKNKREGVIFSLIFSVGRVISYTILGFFSGLLGKGIAQVIPLKWLGLFIIALGIAVFFKVQTKCIVRNFKITGPHMSFVAGILFGLAPCPPLVALLALAALSQSAVTGMIMGFIFGIGTVVSPLIVLGFFSGWFAKQKEFQKMIPYITGVFLVIVGLYYVLAA